MVQSQIVHAWQGTIVSASHGPGFLEAGNIPFASDALGAVVLPVWLPGGWRALLWAVTTGLEGPILQREADHETQA